MSSLRYIALNGSLGTGFKESSLRRGLSEPLDFIAVDSGSTDGGPYYLGTGEWIWAREAYERDLRLGLLGAHRAGVPIIVGSCGGGGGDAAVDGYLQMVQEIVREAGIGVRVATIHCEPDRAWLAGKYRAGQLRELPGAPIIDEQTFYAPGHIVAMAGAEPIQEAIDAGADVVLAGRASDAALFAAIPLARGFDPGAVWNAAKIVECGSAAAENRSGQDCLACAFDDEGFVLEPLDPALRCTPRSVAAHTLYETADPYRLIQPSGTLDARDATYTALDERRTRVVGGTFTPAAEYTAKLEGAAPVGFLSSFWGSTRDPMILAQLDSWIDSLTAHTRDRLAGTFGDSGYDLRITVYGANATTGEPTNAIPREAVLSFDVLAETQEAASAMARAAYHVALHWPIKEWSGSITTFAHPYSRPVVDRGPVYRFTLNHAVALDETERRSVFRMSVQDLR
jgi:Acyclic terpene utilisation family protein AtuA